MFNKFLNNLIGAYTGKYLFDRTNTAPIPISMRMREQESLDRNIGSNFYLRNSIRLLDERRVM